jgi:hypothetical protein
MVLNGKMSFLAGAQTVIAGMAAIANPESRHPRIPKAYIQAQGTYAIGCTPNIFRIFLLRYSVIVECLGFVF